MLIATVITVLWRRRFLVFMLQLGIILLNPKRLEKTLNIQDGLNDLDNMWWYCIGVWIAHMTKTKIKVAFVGIQPVYVGESQQYCPFADPFDKVSHGLWSTTEELGDGLVQWGGLSDVDKWKIWSAQVFATFDVVASTLDVDLPVVFNSFDLYYAGCQDVSILSPKVYCRPFVWWYLAKSDCNICRTLELLSADTANQKVYDYWCKFVDLGNKYFMDHSPAVHDMEELDLHGFWILKMAPCTPRLLEYFRALGQYSLQGTVWIVQGGQFWDKSELRTINLLGVPYNIGTPQDTALGGLISRQDLHILVSHTKDENAHLLDKMWRKQFPKYLNDSKMMSVLYNLFVQSKDNRPQAQFDQAMWGVLPSAWYPRLTLCSSVGCIIDLPVDYSIPFYAQAKEFTATAKHNALTFVGVDGTFLQGAVTPCHDTRSPPVRYYMTRSFTNWFAFSWELSH